MKLRIHIHYRIYVYNWLASRGGSNSFQLRGQTLNNNEITYLKTIVTPKTWLNVHDGQILGGGIAPPVPPAQPPLAS